MNTLSQPYTKFGASQWPSLIQLGLNFGSQFLQGGAHAPACKAPQGCFQCRMTGRGDIAGCLDALLVPLYTGLVNGKIPNQQVFQSFQAALAAISNDAYLDQRTTFAYLQDAKNVLTRLINEYVSANPNAAQSTDNGGTGNVSIGGTNIPTSYFLLGAIGLVGLVLVLKR